MSNAVSSCGPSACYVNLDSAPSPRSETAEKAVAALSRRTPDLAGFRAQLYAQKPSEAMELLLAVGEKLGDNKAAQAAFKKAVVSMAREAKSRSGHSKLPPAKQAIHDIALEFALATGVQLDAPADTVSRGARSHAPVSTSPLAQAFAPPAPGFTLRRG